MGIIENESLDDTELLEQLIDLEEAIIAREEAKSSFWAFVKYIHPYAWGEGEYIESDFAREVCEECQLFYEEMLKGMRPKMGLFAPPQHGKSLLVSRYFPAWAFGQNPKLKIAGCSYDQSLASTISGDVAFIMSLPEYKNIFGKLTGFKGLQNNTEGFQTAYRGRYYAVGVDVGFTGKSVDIGIIDDPHKAHPSHADRERVHKWYNTVFTTRLSAKSGRMMMMTRWDVDDLAGRVESQGWEYHTYPAINDDGTSLTTFKPVDFLLEQKAQLTASQWSSLYMQRPYPEGGNVIKTTNIKRYTILPQNLRNIYIVADTALKAKHANDYTVFGLWAKTTGGEYYLIDWIRAKWEAPEMIRRAVDCWNSWKQKYPILSCFYVEDVSGGTVLLQTLKEKKIPVGRLIPARDKYLRLTEVLPIIDSGYVYIPENALFVSDLLIELEAFSPDEKQSHDDQVDVFVYGLSSQIKDISTKKYINRPNIPGGGYYGSAYRSHNS